MASQDKTPQDESPQGRGGYRSTQRTRKGATTTFGSRTDVGCVREQNEDSLIVAPPLFVVADGMGGHAAGEVASEIAVSTVAKNAPEHVDPDLLGAAVEEANRAIIDAALAGEGREGMGTTCTAAMLEGDRLVIAQVGDSRAYLLHKGALTQITRDHSLVATLVESGQITPAEARVHPKRSVITRALGNDPATRPDIYEVVVEAGDRLLLCSDGLSGMIEDDQIESIMRRVADPQRCASQLVNEAIAAGGHDNVTVIVADVEGTREKQRRKLARKQKVGLSVVIVLLVAVVAGALWGFNEYTNRVAYLGDNDGKVAIYQGVPGSFLGITRSSLIEETDVSLSDLSTTARSNVQQGLRCDSVAAARELVESYQADIKDRSAAKTTGESSAASASGAASSVSSAASSGAASTAESSSGSASAADANSSSASAASATSAASTVAGTAASTGGAA